MVFTETLAYCAHARLVKHPINDWSLPITGHTTTRTLARSENATKNLARKFVLWGFGSD